MKGNPRVIEYLNKALTLLLRGDFEELLRLFDQAFAKKRAADLEHQLDVVLIAQFKSMAEAF